LGKDWWTKKKKKTIPKECKKAREKKPIQKDFFLGEKAPKKKHQKG